MALTKIGSIGINTGIKFAGVTTITTLNSATDTLTIGGPVSIAGTLTYEDVTNVDSVGLITARNGIVVGSGVTLSKDGDGFFTGIVTATTFSGAFSGDGSALTGVANTDVIFPDKISLGDGTTSSGDQINIGVGSDLKLYHDGSNSYIEDSGTGKLNILSSQAQILNPAANEAMAKFIENGAVELYHDNSKKLETASGGVTVTGAVTATSFSGDGSSLTGISGGLTVSDQWRLSALQSITTSDVVLTNWERPDTSGTGGGAYLGSGMSQSSGVFSFPTTGIYLITFIASINVANNAAVRYAEIDIVVTKDNSSYVEAAAGFCCINRPTGEAASGNVTCNFIMVNLVSIITIYKYRFSTRLDFDKRLYWRWFLVDSRFCKR